MIGYIFAVPLLVAITLPTSQADGHGCECKNVPPSFRPYDCKETDGKMEAIWEAYGRKPKICYETLTNCDGWVASHATDSCGDGSIKCINIYFFSNYTACFKLYYDDKSTLVYYCKVEECNGDLHFDIHGVHGVKSKFAWKPAYHCGRDGVFASHVYGWDEDCCKKLSAVILIDGSKCNNEETWCKACDVHSTMTKEGCKFTKIFGKACCPKGDCETNHFSKDFWKKSITEMFDKWSWSV